jgi:hypothetical protein
MAWISKTDYVLWRECAKNAWLKLHRPEVYYAAELTEFEQAVIDAGIEVEGAARFSWRRSWPRFGRLGRVSE